MASEKRFKMPREERAKIFMPFSALRGLEEALEEKRREVEKEDRKYLSLDSTIELDDTLKSIERGDSISLRYYDGLKYVDREENVIKIDGNRGCLYLEEEAVYFSDILSIRKNKK